jgi:hypothetical protein
VTHEEASARAEELNRDHPERDRFRWVARQGEAGAWLVARVELPKPLRRERLTPVTQVKQPTPPDDQAGQLPGGLPPYVAGA